MFPPIVDALEKCCPASDILRFSDSFFSFSDLLVPSPIGGA
jgi:hypothetical protein